jgi:predicted RNA binding protein YcfA (HicA-like mRNA interferase family)
METRMRSRDVIRKIEAAGWVEVRQAGSHKQFRHPTLSGTLTVPHPKKDLPIGTLKSISKASGVQLSGTKRGET